MFEISPDHAPVRRRVVPPRRVVVALLHLVVAGALAVGAACATASGNPFSGGGEGEGALRIEVRNLNVNDATVHAVSSGGRYRLGTVSGKSNARFEIPWQGQQSLRMEIDLLAGDRFTTRPISVTSRDQVQLHIQPVLRRSYIQL